MWAFSMIMACTLIAFCMALPVTRYLVHEYFWRLPWQKQAIIAFVTNFALTFVIGVILFETMINTLYFLVVR